MGRKIDEIMANEKKNIRNNGEGSPTCKFSFWRKEV